MLICGIKLTHDGGVALIDNGRLVCSVETEKIRNNPRYSSLGDLSIVEDILSEAGYRTTDVDKYVLDGWHGTDQDWKGPSLVNTFNKGEALTYEVAPYNESRLADDILQQYTFPQLLQIGEQSFPYTSYMHVTGHITGAYSSSPFAERNESAYILCWDGGLYPRLYYYDADRDLFQNLGHLFLFLGTIYSIFSQYFGPYKKDAAQLKQEEEKKEIEHYFGGYSVAGKIMSYLALGEAKEEVIAVLKRLHEKTLSIENTFEHNFSRAVKAELKDSPYSDADVLMSLHTYLKQLLIENLRKNVERYPDYSANICLTGGCALNIKWNSDIRRSGLFKEVWVPPFPNDAGSAIGVAAAEMFRSTVYRHLSWTVFSGPMIIDEENLPGWHQQECSLEQLAAILYETGEPVLFLHGHAELGPRALGHRSILAPAVQANMKQLLNEVKKREDFRPVAPICLEHAALEIFDPGTPDPYMLFDHQVRTQWLDRVPAICHLDGSARLQTVNETMNESIYALLTAYEKLSGIPLLCNTSANYNGSGFFPDIASAAKWGKVNYIWCNNRICIKEEKAVWKTRLPEQVSYHSNL